MRGSDAIGKATEFKLASKLIELGHVPFWPMMDTGYDMGIVVNKKFVKLQCKGSERSTKICLRIGRNSGKIGERSTRIYEKKDCDFIIIYLSHYETWYVIPVDAINVSGIELSITDRCKWNRYKDAWGLLGAP